MNKIQQFLKVFISCREYDFYDVCHDLQVDHSEFLNELNKCRDHVAYVRYNGKITLVHKG